MGGNVLSINKRKAMMMMREDLKATVKQEIFRDNVSDDEYAAMLRQAAESEES